MVTHNSPQMHASSISSSTSHSVPVLSCTPFLNSIQFHPLPSSDHPLQSPTLSLPPSLLSHLDAATIHLRSSRLVAFPTETVYGLGAHTLDPVAVKRVYALKGRPADNPLIVHVSSLEMLQRLLPASYKRSALYSALIDCFWPGPLTLLFPNPNPPPLPAPQTLAIRIPSHPLARALIHHSDLPISAPSANSSGRPSPTSARHVQVDLGCKVLPPREGDEESQVLGCILDGGSCDVGVESTVVDGLEWDEVNGGVLKVLRPGGVGVEELEVLVKRVELECGMEGGMTRIWVHGRDEKTTTGANLKATSVEPKESVVTSRSSSIPKLWSDKNGFPSTPGMKYKHYSPSIPVFLLLPNDTFREIPLGLEGISQPGRPAQVLEMIASEVRQGKDRSTRDQAKLQFGLMHFDNSALLKRLTALKGPNDRTPWEIVSLSLGSNADDAARALFGGMLRLEGRTPTLSETKDIANGQEGVDAILIEGCSDVGRGLAVMERVRKAVGGGGKGATLTTVADGKRTFPSTFWVDVS